MSDEQSDISELYCHFSNSFCSLNLFCCPPPCLHVPSLASAIAPTLFVETCYGSGILVRGLALAIVGGGLLKVCIFTHALHFILSKSFPEPVYYTLFNHFNTDWYSAVSSFTSSLCTLPSFLLGWYFFPHGLFLFIFC